MPRVWRFFPHDESRVRQLSRQLQVSPLLAQVLLARGYNTPEAAVRFLKATLHDLYPPEMLPGLDDAAERIVAAVKANRRITIYGDYDVDGVTATSLLYECLQLTGTRVDYYIPCRLEEGYGLNNDAIRQLHAEDPQRLLISVDCGIASVQEAALARELGLELIVTDHHQMSDTLPEACLVHPRLPGGSYPFGDLCGAGVAFKLAWGVCQRLGEGGKALPRMREFLVAAVGLAAIGTVADVVPLLDENRVIVRYGLESLLTKQSIGLKELFRVAGIKPENKLTAEDIAFSIGPRINAAGRLGQARLAVELLTTHNAERAKTLAEYLDQLNNNRKTVERRILKRAKELVAENPAWESAPALILADEDWHPGVIGIVASRVAEHFQKPAVLLSINRETRICHGSGRSFAGYDLYAGLAACSEQLAGFGGHAAAAGVQLPQANLHAFREAFCSQVGRNHTVSNRDLELCVDAEIRLADCSRNAVLELDQLGPFGQKNPRPVFAATQIQLAEPPRKMGEGDRHLSLKVKQFNTVLRAVAFGKGEWADELERESGPLSISFAPGINRYRGYENVELQLLDWQSGNGPARPPREPEGVGLRSPLDRIVT